jgi:hypothetical protein
VPGNEKPASRKLTRFFLVAAGDACQDTDTP